jgi:hypothetical protein
MTQLMIAVDSVSWAPVTAPIDAKTVIFDNNESGAQSVNRRIDSADADTQKTISAGSQAVWTKSSDPRSWTRFSAFKQGTVIAYLKSVSGSFNVAVEFIE